MSYNDQQYFRPNSHGSHNQNNQQQSNLRQSIPTSQLNLHNPSGSWQENTSQQFGVPTNQQHNNRPPFMEANYQQNFFSQHHFPQRNQLNYDDKYRFDTLPNNNHPRPFSEPSKMGNPSCEALHLGTFNENKYEMKDCIPYNINTHIQQPQKSSFQNQHNHQGLPTKNPPQNYPTIQFMQPQKNQTRDFSMFSIPPPPHGQVPFPPPPFPPPTMPPPPMPIPPFVPPQFSQGQVQHSFANLERPTAPISNWTATVPQNLHLAFQKNNYSPVGTSPEMVGVKQQTKMVVEEWLKAKSFQKHLPIENAVKKIKLNEYKTAMGDYIKSLEKLRELNDELAGNMSSDEHDWKRLLEAIDIVKIELENKKRFLFDGEQIKDIQKQIEGRRKKRMRLKEKRKKNQEKYKENLTKRLNENERIDQWQAEEQRKIEEKKMIDTLKNEAGESLQEVKTKSAEASQIIKKLDLLQQLREMRKDRAIFKGILVMPRDSENFSKSVEKVSEMLEKQIKIYKDEEKALRVLREEETEELERKHAEKQKKRKEKRKSALDKVDPLYAYRLYWRQGEENVTGLVHIRSLWDMYICADDDPLGSRIPQEWVSPAQPSSEGWKACLVSSDTNN